jgi:hypothetical protein
VGAGAARGTPAAAEPRDHGERVGRSAAGAPVHRGVNVITLLELGGAAEHAHAGGAARRARSRRSSCAGGRLLTTRRAPWRAVHFLPELVRPVAPLNDLRERGRWPRCSRRWPRAGRSSCTRTAARRACSAAARRARGRRAGDPHHPRLRARRAGRRPDAPGRRVGRAARGPRTDAFISVSRANIEEGRAWACSASGPSTWCAAASTSPTSRARRSCATRRARSWACRRPRRWWGSSPAQAAEGAVGLRGLWRSASRRRGRRRASSSRATASCDRRSSAPARRRPARGPLLLGWRRDVPALLGALDVLVLTSRWEGLPRVCPQAMAPPAHRGQRRGRRARGRGRRPQRLPLRAGRRRQGGATACCAAARDPALAARFGAAGRGASTSSSEGRWSPSRSGSTLSCWPEG